VPNINQRFLVTNACSSKRIPRDYSKLEHTECNAESHATLSRSIPYSNFCGSIHLKILFACPL